MDLHLDNAPDIHVCTVLPAVFDTPLFQHAANYTGRQLKAMNPVYSAEQVAEAIAGLVERPQREIIVAQAGQILVAQSTFTPELYERTAARQIHQDHFADQPAPATEGNLFELMPEYTDISGGWERTGEPITQVLDMAKQAAQKLGLPIS